MLLTKFIKNLTKIQRLTSNKFSTLFNDTRKFHFSQIQLKFNYGQGGCLSLNLTMRTYDINFQTIWQDYSLMSYSGLTGQHSLTIMEKQSQAIIDDLDLVKKQQELIKMSMKIPQDFTIEGCIHGSIRHNKNNISSKLRTRPFNLTILGYKNVFQWLTMQSENIKLQNLEGDVNISSLTLKDGLINCQNFYSSKVLYSGKVHINAKMLIKVRSIIAYGDAACVLKCETASLESISGKLNIECQKLNIKRVLSSDQGIRIKCSKIEQLIIDSGTGIVECSDQQSLKMIKLGKMHKGRLVFHQNIAKIQSSST